MSGKATVPYKDVLATWVKSKMSVMRNPPTPEEVDNMNHSELERLADCIERILQ